MQQEVCEEKEVLGLGSHGKQKLEADGSYIFSSLLVCGCIFHVMFVGKPQTNCVPPAHVSEEGQVNPQKKTFVYIPVVLLQIYPVIFSTI